jgi:hypothetical protein
MKEAVGDVVSYDAVEIMMSVGSERQRCSVVCLWCQRARQQMNDDGCGICDASLDLPVRASDDLDGLEHSFPFFHLSPITRIR